jgi:copper homeostasis protein
MLVEIVCQSVGDAETTAANGAGRIELVAALATGGLTPSPGTVAEIKARVVPSVPVMAMVRPRPGGFVYTDAEQAVMRRDAAALVAAGADGLVFGALRDDQSVDAPFCAELVTLCAGRQAVFHRAFDLTPDPFAALEILIELGVTRVLTSGQAASALDGAEVIRDLRERAAGRIEILPGGGVRAGNIGELARRTGCDQFHLAPLLRVEDPTARGAAVDYGGYDAVDGAAVAAAVHATRQT